MKKLIVVVVLFLFPFFAMAGFEPSPFQPEINQLGAVANILSSADFRIARTISVPPEPCVPPDPCQESISDINKLESIGNQLTLSGDIVGAMIEEVMGLDPSPFREDLVAPLEVVRSAANDIVEDIYAVMGVEPSPFYDALQSVAGAAMQVVDIAEEGIELFSSTPALCSDYFDQESCNNAIGCVWVISDNTGSEPYCGTVDY
jgi:hypothetical protein